MEKRENSLILETNVANRYLFSKTNIAHLESLWRFNPTTRKFGGLGLGLALVRHWVELHGGAVRANSSGEGQGATFTIQLLLMPTPSQTNQDNLPPQQSLDLNGIKILVVEDKADMRELQQSLSRV